MGNTGFKKQTFLEEQQEEVQEEEEDAAEYDATRMWLTFNTLIKLLLAEMKDNKPSANLNSRKQPRTQKPNHSVGILTPRYADSKS